MRVRVSRVVLVGLSGAGKSTVGPRLAEELGWSFVDVDVEVVEAEGLDIAAIFRTRGEAAFRALEARAVRQVLTREKVVVAAGGGWAVQPGALTDLPEGTALVWLRVTVEEAAKRLQVGGDPRPLLAQGDMATRLAELDAERSAIYARANVSVRTDDTTPEAVAQEIAKRLVSEYGIDGRAD